MLVEIHEVLVVGIKVSIGVGWLGVGFFGGMVLIQCIMLSLL